MPKISKKTKVVPDQDLISNLPDEMKSEILISLPILDAVKTSILAKKWRYTWASIPVLSFSEEDITSSCEFISIIDQVLSLHTGNIQSFFLKYRTSSEKALYRWLLILSRHLIDELSLCSLSPVKGGRIPSILFSFELLKFLELDRCILTIPRTFNGFAALHTLNLTNLMITDGLSRLLSCCPLLLSLFITDCKFGTETDIGIYAPKLRTLYICASFRCIHLFTPSLVKAEIEPWIDSSNEVQSIAMKNSLSETLGDLPAVEILKLFCFFSRNVGFQTHPITLKNLRHLELDINLHSDSEVGLALIPLLRGAPLLEYLRLAAYAKIKDPDRAVIIMNFWSSENNQNCIFKNLKILKIENLECETTPPIVALENLLEFLKFIVGSAPVLEKLALMDFFSPGGEPEMVLLKKQRMVLIKRQQMALLKKQEMVLLKKLLMFPRASSKAQILVC